jgi:cobalt/nickel transport system permease protein
MGTGGLVALCLVLSSSNYVPSARIMLATYIPLMFGEGVITGFAVVFIRRVKPELLKGEIGI